ETAAGAASPNGASPTPPPAAPAATLPADDRRRLDQARELMAAARRAADLDEPLTLARSVADAHPRSAEAQHLAAEIAYRASRWPLAVAYFRRGGEPVESPERMFYLAVALWEAGDRGEAARVLEATLPRLARTPFVDRYVDTILGEER
ncbi:MAG TPA: hypothetical protein VHM02_13220, partial [Thermoanaerobaculia bacterium]|nr:hypothetical protein [Thermoanaerobaculia bacterium]